MKEAQKMMQDPAFQKQLKKLQNSKEFKESLKQTQEMLKDPNVAAHAEAKMEHMAKVGTEALKQRAGAAVENAMDEALNNPQVMQEMAKMIRDPAFAKQIEEMSKSPEFQNYLAAVSV
jgi:mannitol/fructose-specific phosphotransferase system IIA component (Ntr-type)